MADLIYAEYDFEASGPKLWVTWRDAARELRQFATDPADFTLRLAERDDPDTVVLVKTNGWVGYDTNPNVIGAWAVDGDISLLDPAVYEGELEAVDQATGEKSYMPVVIRIKPRAGTGWSA